MGLRVDIFNVPSWKKYKEAFCSLKGKRIPANHMKMLEFHFHAPQATATCAELADAAGYKGPYAVNGQYGQFAGRLCDELSLQLRTNLSILATWNDDSDEVLKMRDEVVKALKDLDWF